MFTRKFPVGRQILWLSSAMILCIVAPLLLHEATGGSSNPRNPYWSLGIIMVSGTAYAGVIAGRRRQLFGMMLWLFTYIFMGLAPYTQYRLDTPLGNTPGVDESLYPLAGILVLASSLTALAGMSIANGKSISRHIGQSRVDPLRANILTAAGAAIFLYYGSVIGFGSFLISRNELGALRGAAWGNPATASLLTGAMNMTLLVAFISQMTVRHQRKVAGKRPPLLPVLLVGALLLYVVNPISGARYLVGTVYLAVLACFGAYATMRRFRVMAIAALFGMLTIFPLADAFRNTLDANIKVVGPVESMLSGDFDAFAQLANTLSYIESEGVTWGWQLLGVLLFWVPRSVWPGKPVDTGVLLAEFKGYDFTNLSSPIWSELLVNFGWIGVLAGMGLLGFWFRTMDRRADVYLRTFPIPPVVVCATTFYLLIVLRGSLLNAASYLLVILLASWFVTGKRPKRDPPSSLNVTDTTGSNTKSIPGLLRR